MAESKPETRNVGKSVAEKAPVAADQPIGKRMADAREGRGLSRKDVAREARIPEHYVKMIESDDYSLIADQVYMLPFIRRYAEFVSLDPEEIVGRFVRDVQKADVVAARMSKPIPMVEKRSRSRQRRIILIAAIIVVALVAAGLFVRLSRVRRLNKTTTVQSSTLLHMQLPKPSLASSRAVAVHPLAQAAKAPAGRTSAPPSRQ